MAKKRMPIYEIIDILKAILAHNLVKYKHFSLGGPFGQTVNSKTCLLRKYYYCTESIYDLEI